MSVDEVGYIWGEHKRILFTLEHLLRPLKDVLLMIQEVAEVNMKEVALIAVNHNITRMSITETKHIGGDTIPCSGPNENFSELL